MELITDFYVFLASVVLISLSGVMMPGPLFAITIEKAAKRKYAGLLISAGHGIVEFPLMFLIYFALTQFVVPDSLKITIGIFGGLLMMIMGLRIFLSRNKPDDREEASKQDTLVAGIWTTAANAGFILWWLTIGTTLIINAQYFGLIGFSIFAVTHWMADFVWYTIVAFAIFKSRRFWSKRVHQAITLFCFAVLAGFGVYFFVSAIWLAVSTFV
jgi:threonine/homoserine/homoserine lactone efflux protein